MKTTYLLKILISLLFAMTVSFTYSQDGPGDPGGDPSGSGDPLGGEAPTSGGMILMLTLGAFYGGSKVYHIIRKESNLIH
jgi:hypothetical protein